MTVYSRLRWCALGALLIVGLLLPACAQVDLDPEPPYPQREKDYSYPEEEDYPPPWEDPEDYPYVTITSPAEGEFVAPGTVDVTGTYAGPVLSGFVVNGKEVALSGGSFATTVDVPADSPTWVIEAQATTEERGLVSADRSTVIVGTASAVDDPVAMGLALDLENRGMSVVANALGDALDGVDLSGLFGPRLAAEGKAGIEVSSAILTGVDLTLQSQTDGLAIGAVVGRADITVSVFGLPLTISAEGLLVDMLAAVTVDAGEITIALVDSSVKVASMTIDNALLDQVASYLVSMLLDLLVDTQIPGLLEDLLADLDLTITGNGYDLALVPGAAVSTDRNFSFALNSALTVTDANLWNPDFQPEGFRSTASAPATFPEKTPVTALPYGLAIGANDDFLNQLFYALAGTNSLSFEVTDDLLRAEVFSLLFFSFRTMDPETPLVLRFSPTVAPLVVGDAQNNTMFLVLAGFHGQILADRGSAGLWEAMSFDVDVTAPLSFAFHEDGSFGLNLGDLDIDLDIEHNPVGQKNVPNTERLLTELFGNILPDLLAGLEGIEIQFPELAGIDISLADVATYGEIDDNLGIFIDLQ